MVRGKPILVKFFIGVYTIFLSMLYEKSRVSQYERKDRPGKVKTQINLGLNSEFEKDKEVVVLYLDDFEDMEEQIQNPTGDTSRISELETKIQSLDSENTSLKAEIENIKFIHAVIWLSLASHCREDYDSMCLAFYNGVYLINEFL